MDESWRMRMGMPTAPPPRRSTEDSTSHRLKPISDDPLNPEDFRDVFGGPPQTVLSCQFSTCFPRSSSSSSSTSFCYEEIFRPSEKAAATRKSGRSLPAFRIPGQTRKSSDHRNQHKRQSNNGFYSDIFGLEDETVVIRSRSRSKASSSSVLSSEELSPFRPAIAVDRDDDVSFFASKLRPINVIRPINPTPQFAGIREAFCSSEKNGGGGGGGTDNLRSYPFGLSRRNASPETISLEPISNSLSAEDVELNSPSSAVSSICQSSEQEQRNCEMEEEEEDEDEIMSSYVIEINSDRNRCEWNGVDEAIAWAKEKLHGPQDSDTKSGIQECETEKPTEEDCKMLNGHEVSEGQIESVGSLVAEEETEQFEFTLEAELQKLDEKIRLWSTGKEADIRLLLSSLHHIIRPDSVWLAIPLSNIIEISQVKKAYQKARLCLHPDKLQQRGATLPQKYVARKAFSILQDAWTSFISQDVL